MSNHLENTYLGGTSAGTNGSSAYPQELIPQNLPWRVTPRPYPVGFPAAANPDYVYEPRCVVRFLPYFNHFVCQRLLQAPGDAAYRANTTPLYPWRVHSDALKTMIRNLMLQFNSEVVEVRKETCGPNRSKVTIVLEMPDEV